MFSITTLSSQLPEASHRPSGLKASAVTHSRWYLRMEARSHVLVLHRIIVLSHPEVASSSPEGLNWAQHTLARWPFSTCSHCPLPTLYTETTSPAPATARSGSVGWNDRPVVKCRRSMLRVATGSPRENSGFLETTSQTVVTKFKAVEAASMLLLFMTRLLQGMVLCAVSLSLSCTMESRLVSHSQTQICPFTSREHTELELGTKFTRCSIALSMF
mmetsp:Transcript_31233/g.88572  ORF Transcript_31233/g.88572 Transcript_31233/m.88572 type:complete len:216 (-) Transcript_31233:632-1279(-)